MTTNEIKKQIDSLEFMLVHGAPMRQVFHNIWARPEYTAEDIQHQLKNLRLELNIRELREC